MEILSSSNLFFVSILSSNEIVFISIRILDSFDFPLTSISLITSLKIGTVGKLRIITLDLSTNSLILFNNKPPKDVNIFAF